MHDRERTARIRELNDEFRTTGDGGRVLMSGALLALGEQWVREIVATVRGFDDFDEDNDPHGEHDCAAMTVGGVRVIWKIDYFDKRIEAGSPDPADPVSTTRILTVMLAEEY